MPAPPSSKTKAQNSASIAAAKGKSGSGGTSVKGSLPSGSLQKSSPGSGTAGPWAGPAYSNKATYSPGTPFSIAGGGRSTAYPGVNYSSADYMKAGYGQYQQPPGGGMKSLPVAGRQDSGTAGPWGGPTYRNPPVYSTSQPFKDQSRVPTGDPRSYTEMAFPASSPGITPVRGGLGALGFDRPFPGSPEPAGAMTDAYDSVPDGTSGGYTAGDGMVPDSQNVATNAARRIAAKLSGPFAKTDAFLGRTFPGMTGATPQGGIGSNSGQGGMNPQLAENRGAEGPPDAATRSAFATLSPADKQKVHGLVAGGMSWAQALAQIAQQRGQPVAGTAQPPEFQWNQWATG